MQYEIGKFACECPVVIFVIAVGLRTIFNSVTLYECIRNRLIEFACAIDLTRFNNIAIQGTPQMAVDKEAISLSRVYLNTILSVPAVILCVTRLN